MANWVAASAVRGLFAQSSAANAVAPTSGRTVSGGAPATGRPSVASGAPATGRSSPASSGPASARPRRAPIHVTPIDEDDDYDTYDEAPPVRQPRRRSRGLSTGAWIAIIGGSVGALLLLGGVILVVSLLSGGGSYTTPTILPGQRDHRSVHFNAGRVVEITVTSDLNSDMDLFVMDALGRMVASDTSIGPNSHVTFTPLQSGTYQLVVANVSQIPNRSHVRYRQ
jgi:hypothetical protein